MLIFYNNLYYRMILSRYTKALIIGFKSWKFLLVIDIIVNDIGQTVKVPTHKIERSR